MANDDAVVQAVDDLTENGSIRIPSGEVRRPVLFPEARTGAFHTRLELSEFGVKASIAGHLAPLRLRRLIGAIYNESEGETSDELDWHLREVPGKTLAARLDEFLRTASPKRVIADLILIGREPSEVAIRHLGISDQATPSLSRTQLMDRILWKLGFVVNEPRTVPQRFWELHEELAQSARSALVSTSVNEEAVRGLSANYFEQLERVLSDTLAFAAWALTHDHVTAERPFHYDDDTCREFGLKTLQESPCNVEGQEHMPLVFSDHSTLYGLCRGFAILADHLQDLEVHGDAHLRDSESLPRYASNTTLQKFPFRHVVPFLDLVPASRTRIVQMLHQVSRDLVRAKVSDARNSQVHYRRAASDLHPLIESLEATRVAVRELEDLGLVRALFAPRRVERDEWDRTTAYLADGRGREVVLGRPSEFSWLNLPPISSPQYLVVSAQFADPNEVLRFTIGVPSEFTKIWSGIPARRRDSGHVRRTRQSERDSTLRLIEPAGE